MDEEVEHPGGVLDGADPGPTLPILRANVNPPLGMIDLRHKYI